MVAQHDVSTQRAVSGGASQVEASLSALARFGTPDAFVIARETSAHASVVDELLVTGRPIFVEKPLCTSDVDAQRFANVGEGSVFVMDKWRYHPGVRALREIVRSGTLGSLVGMRLRRNQPGTHHQDVESPWTLLPHDLAIVDELLGEVPPLLDVVGDVLDGWTHGVTARFGTDPWVVVESFGRSPRKEREVLVLGTEGAAVLDDGYASVVSIHRFANGGELVLDRTVDATGELPLLAELREFVAFVDGGPPPRAGAASGARHVRIINEILNRLRPTGMNS